MKIRTLVFGAIIGTAGLTGIGVTGASATIVCNHENECWHTKIHADYKNALGLTVHGDDKWRWKGNDFHWREHDGLGYWHKGVWVNL